MPIQQGTHWHHVTELCTGGGCTLCPPNLTPTEAALKEHNGLCYQFVNNEMSWVSARQDCHDKGGYLAEVSDQATQDFLVTSLHSLNWQRHGVWIGATDHDEEGTWIWDTGNVGFLVVVVVVAVVAVVVVVVVAAAAAALVVSSNSSSRDSCSNGGGGGGEVVVVVVVVVAAAAAVVVAVVVSTAATAAVTVVAIQ